MKFHPDRNPDDPTAEERFKEASEAYAVLSDADKRARYDRFGHEGVAGDGFTGFDPSAFGDFADILGDLFGFGVRRHLRRPSRRGPRRSAARSRPPVHPADLTLEEAAVGVERTIRIPRQDRCGACDGTGGEPGTSPGDLRDLRRSRPGDVPAGLPLGVPDLPDLRRCRARQPASLFPVRAVGAGWKSEANLKVTVPAGVDTGMRLRLAGEGEAGDQGGPAGDLYVVLAVEEHDELQT